jgi:hypothetical protein
MAWLYEQATGDLFHNGTFVGTGYSGRGKTRSEGRNNEHVEAIVKVGPIPRGKWRIGKPVNSEHTGPFSLPLKQVPPRPLRFGRTAFLIHGNNKADNASEGCIILARAIRDQIVASGDTDLEVVARV